jgi:hypothetical protein
MNLFLLTLASLDSEALSRLEAIMVEGHERAEPKNTEPEVDQELAAWARSVVRDPATDPAEAERAEDILAELEEGHVVSVFRGTSTIIWQRTQEWERKPGELRIGSRLWRPRASC